MSEQKSAEKMAGFGGVNFAEANLKSRIPHSVFLPPQHPNYSRKRMMPSEAPQMALHVEAEEVEAAPVSGNAVAYR